MIKITRPEVLKLVNFSQEFIVCHGCGNGYLDGKRKIIPKNRKCLMPTYYPFWKKPIDVRNRVETRAQLNLKTKVTRKQFCRYMRYVDVFSRDSFSSSDYSDSDGDSLNNNASDTEQNLYSDNETKKLTGENLIIDEKVNTTQTNLISETQNPGNNEENK